MIMTMVGGGWCSKEFGAGCAWQGRDGREKVEDCAYGVSVFVYSSVWYIC